MGKKQDKTNVMRLLDQKKIAYDFFQYDETVTDGILVAGLLGQPCDHVFKTLVTVSSKGINYVFVIPVDKSLDLKAAAISVGEKSISMIKQKELLPLTGYIHGGCSPIGMKKPFETVIDCSAESIDYFCISGGHIGRQIKVNPHDVQKITGAKFYNISKDMDN